MTLLILEHASVSRPSGQWRHDDYDVLEDGVVVGRIFCLDAVGPRGRPWMWASGHHGHIRHAAVWLTATPSQFARLAIRSLLRGRVTRRNPRLQSLGNPGGSPEAARKALNKSTILEMHRAFNVGGRKAIEKVMRNQPAVFLKLLVLLVPREMQVEHKGGVKAMTDEQLEAAFELLQGMVDQRLGEKAKIIEGAAETVLPAPDVVPDGANKAMHAADTAVEARKGKSAKGSIAVA
jgi:hypothetical protein